jgi:hypothetical protein
MEDKMYNKVNMDEHYKTDLYLNCGMKQFNQLNKLDKSFVGTNDYMGLAYFWDHEVKWWLREATAYQRVKVHKLFIKNNVPFCKKDKCFITNDLALKICHDVFETNKQQKVA